MHAALSPKAHLGAPQHGWRAPTPSAGAPARPAGRKLAVWCQAASGNGNGNGNGASGAVGVEAERMRFAEEQSETAKMDQASILRKRAADALSAQRRLMEELQEQEARFASLDAALQEARRQADSANRKLSQEQLTTDAVWAVAQTEVLARDPWNDSVVAQPGAAVKDSRSGGGQGAPDMAAWAQRAWAQWTGSGDGAREPPRPAAAPAEKRGGQPAAARTSPAPAAAPAAAPEAPVAGQSFLEALAAAASSTIARLTSPDARARQLDGLRLKLKSDLLLRVASLERGSKATTAEKLEVEGLLASLGSVNPTPQPARSPLSDGRWNCIYTTSTQLLGTRLPPLLRPAGPLYMSFNTAESIAALDTTWPVTAQRAVLKVTSSSSLALEWQSLKLFRVFSLPVADAKAKDTAFLDTIYLDLDMRLMRGQNGTVYVLIQDNPFYKIADNDRGVGQGALPAGRPSGTDSKRRGGDA